MKRRILALLFVLVVVLLVGCRGEEAVEEEAVEEVAEEETAEEVEEELEAVEEEEAAEEAAAEEEEAEEEAEEEEEEEAAEEETEEADYTVIEVEGCEDTDGGLNYDEAGTVTDVHDLVDADYCSQNENYAGRLYEVYCLENGKRGRETYDCPSGLCQSGACAEAEE